MHLYPARMHPEIARRVIAKYARKDTDIVFDPFMGSGGVLLEAILHGNNSVGFDINPFAVLLSKVKTTPITSNLNAEMDAILKKSAKDILHKRCYPKCIPLGYDVSAWFDPSVLNTLAILKHHVSKIANSHVLDFFRICLSLTVRKSSYQRNGAWKIHRISVPDRMKFSPDPAKIFADVCSDNITRMNNFTKAKPQGTAYPILADSRSISSNFAKIDHILNDGKANLIVTSPPYGDHKTTVAYGQFSRHSGHWIDLPDDDIMQVDREGLGGRAYKNMDDLGSDTLNCTLDKIRKNDSKMTQGKTPCRDRDVYSFFLDLDSCMMQASQNMATVNAHACFVVANRTVRRVTVPTDVILTELGKKYGFVVEDTIYRDIPNKAMPSKNAPENIANEMGNTMTQETVIIMRC